MINLNALKPALQTAAPIAAQVGSGALKTAGFALGFAASSALTVLVGRTVCGYSADKLDTLDRWIDRRRDSRRVSRKAKFRSVVRNAVDEEIERLIATGKLTRNPQPQAAEFETAC